MTKKVSKFEMNYMDRVCLNCHEEIPATEISEGKKAWVVIWVNLKVLFAIILLFLFPIGTIIGIYMLVTATENGMKCPECGKEQLVKASSKAAHEVRGVANDA